MTKLEALKLQHGIALRLLLLNQALDISELKEPDMAVSPEVATLISDMDDATNQIAARIQTLINKPSVSLSAEDKQAFQDEIAKLKALGQDQSNPVPSQG